MELLRCDAWSLQSLATIRHAPRRGDPRHSKVPAAQSRLSREWRCLKSNLVVCASKPPYLLSSNSLI
jgi:hypothetical protein